VTSLRERAEDAAMLGRLGRDLPRYLRRPLSVEEARRRVSLGVERRERRFLALVDRTVYGDRRSPYRVLLRHVGCERGDLHALVVREGLESTLRHLAALGVFVSFDEFKGRRAAVRGSARFTFSERDFDNPLAPSHYVELTGGSRGRPMRVGRSQGAVTDMAASFALALEAHGVVSPRAFFWNGAGLSWAFAHLKLSNPIERWLYPIDPLPRLTRLAHGYVAVLARMAGTRIPPLQHVDVQEPERVVDELARLVPGERPIVVNSTVSSAVRVASAAASMGRPLAGVTFHTRSEPLTPTRRRAIEVSGARALADYAAVELSSIAYACGDGIRADDMHLNLDRYAAIEREREVVEGGPYVDALLFSTLSPDAPKIALNVELGDSARVERRECRCSLGALGLTTHLSEIRSFEKLSSEGTSFARSNLVQILEETLPSRFGGSAVDYQVVEEEGQDGSAVLVLRVHPRVGDADAEALRAVLFEELGRGGIVDQYQVALLRRAASIVVRRLPPLTTRAGKVLPFHLTRTTADGGGVRA